MRGISLFCVFACVYNTIGYHVPAPLDKYGKVVDTPEVAHAKHEHYAALSKAGGAVPHVDQHASYYGYAQQHEYSQQTPKEDYRYHGPPAPLNYDGTVAETPEIKHLKAEHLAVLSKAYANAPHPHLNHDGTVAETPEVQHLKAKHLSQVAEAYAKAPRGHDDMHKVWKRSAYYKVQTQVPAEIQGYHGPPAPLNHDGTVAETPEVKAAKAVHLEAHAKALQSTLSHPVAQQFQHEWQENIIETPKVVETFKYRGPAAPLNHDGTVAETPEVRHLKAEHLAAVAEAFAKAPRDHSPVHPHSVWKRSTYQNFNAAQTGYYQGPPAPLNHDGTVAETPEVKAAKSVHLQAHAKALESSFSYPAIQHSQPKWQDNVIETQHGETQKYQGPPAPLNHDGTVAETSEVQHLKAERLAVLADAYAKAPQDYTPQHPHTIWKRSTFYYNNDAQSGHYQGPPAPLNHDGTVAETPEVKIAKAVHFQAHAKALEEIYANPSFEQSEPKWQENVIETPHVEAQKYHGPPAPLNHDGTVAETPEVQHLKAQHLAAVADAFAKAPRNYSPEQTHKIWKRSTYPNYNGVQSGYYHGPPAPLNHDGTVAETHEVKAAKAVHFEAHAKALQGTFSHPFVEYSEPKWQENVIGTPQVETYKYHGPPAPLNHDGTVAETPEVQHVKAERLAILAEAYAKAPQDYIPEQTHKVWKRSAYQNFNAVQSGHYHGPPAPLNHDGTVAETPEVKAAKAVHFDAHAKAVHGSFSYPVVQYSQPKWQENVIETPHVETHKYHGPPAPLNHDGTVAETPEVQHVKTERLAVLAEAYAKAPQDYIPEQTHKVWKRSAYENYNAIQSGHYHGPPAPLNHDGTVAETPEVKAAKAIHFDAHAKAMHGSFSYPVVQYSQPKWQENVIETPHVETHKYHGPPAPLNHDGTVAETAEVQHVKAERLAALAEAYAKAPQDYIPEQAHNVWKRSAYQSYDDQSGHYHGPPAPLNRDGTVAETPEVISAKAVHFQAHAKFAQVSPVQKYQGSYVQTPQTSPQKYHGPPAPLNHDGTVAETPEVKHLKAEHLVAVAEAFAKAPKGDDKNGFLYETYSQPQNLVSGYKHFVPAPLNHDGTVAETPEVHARRIEHLVAHHKALVNTI